MKRFLVAFLGCVSIMSTFAMTGFQFTQGVDDFLKEKLETLKSDVPDEVSHGYDVSMRHISQELMDIANKTDEDKQVTKNEMVPVLLPVVTEFLTLVQDHKDFLATGKSRFLITDTEKQQVESQILGYQKSIVGVLESWMRIPTTDISEQMTFSFALKNTQIDVQVSSPKISHVLSLSQGRQSMDLQLDFDAKISGPTVSHLSGTLDISVVQDKESIYLKINTLKTAFEGDQNVKAMVDAGLKDIQSVMDELAGRYLKITAPGSSLDMNSLAKFHDIFTVLRGNALFKPFERIKDGSFLLSMNPQTVTKITDALGIPSEDNIDMDTDTDTDMLTLDLNANGGSKVGMYRSESAYWYFSQSASGIVGFTLHGDDQSGYEILNMDVEIQNLGNDLMIKISDDDMMNLDISWQKGRSNGNYLTFKVDDHRDKIDVSWKDGQLNAAYNDGTQNFALFGTLTFASADLTFTRDSTTQGKFSWSTTGDSSQASIGFTFWDEEKTSFLYNMTDITQRGQFSVNTPSNTLDIENLKSLKGIQDFNPIEVVINTQDALTQPELPSEPVGKIMPLDERVKLLRNTHIQQPSNSVDTIFVVYTDLECLGCGQFSSWTLAPIVQDKTSHIAVVYKHYPLPYHPHAYDWAIESECVAKNYGNEEFFKYVAARYVSQDGSFSEVYPKLTQSQLDACKNDPFIKNRIANDIASGKNYMIEGVPTSIILNPKTGYYETIYGGIPSDELTSMLERVKNN